MTQQGQCLGCTMWAPVIAPGLLQKHADAAGRQCPHTRYLRTRKP